MGFSDMFDNSDILKVDSYEDLISYQNQVEKYLKVACAIVLQREHSKVNEQSVVFLNQIKEMETLLAELKESLQSYQNKKQKLLGLQSEMAALQKHLVQLSKCKKEADSCSGESILKMSSTYKKVVSDTIFPSQPAESQEPEETNILHEPASSSDPGISFVTEDELKSLPNYLRGRMTLDVVNEFVCRINSMFSKKYSIIYLPPRAVKKEWDLWKSLRHNEISETKGVYFLARDDFKTLSGRGLSKSELSIVNILRSTRRIKEERIGNFVYYELVCE